MKAAPVAAENVLELASIVRHSSRTAAGGYLFLVNQRQRDFFGPVIALIPYDDEQDAVRIANDSRFGLSGAVVFGWVFASHQVGAAIAAISAAAVRDGLGQYTMAWYGAGALCLVAAAFSLVIPGRRVPRSERSADRE